MTINGADGIRANAVNADRIRSGLLTDDFIADRARARGVSETDYMAGNLLRREFTADPRAPFKRLPLRLERAAVARWCFAARAFAGWARGSGAVTASLVRSMMTVAGGT